MTVSKVCFGAILNLEFKYTLAPTSNRTPQKLPQLIENWNHSIRFGHFIAHGDYT